MRAFELSAFGLDHLQPTDRPEPVPGPGEAVVRIRAVSLNYRDLLMVRGHYNPRQPLPLIPCSDGAGEVVSLGPGCQRVKPGDRVCPIFSQRWWGGPPDRERLRATLGGPLDGTLQELMLVREEGLVKIPAHLDWAQAACLPCAALTAWNALTYPEPVPPGGTVLVQGTGGVSLFALQLARAMGLRVALTSSSDAKLERGRALGAEFSLNYKTQPAWGKALREWATEGVDRVVEVGGAATMEQSLKAVRLGGQVSVIGVLSGTREPLDLLPLLMGQVRMQGILVGSRDDFEAMNRALFAWKLEPVVDRAFPWVDAPQAFQTLASQSHFGKLVITA